MPLKSRVQGFTLIEALIALVVLSVGLLGSAAMLLESLRAHGESLRKIAATNLLTDMRERIRANAATGDPRESAEDQAHFTQAARNLLPGAASATVDFEPAIGPASLDHLVLTLRWQEPGSGEAMVSLQLLAQSPVAG